MPSFLILFFLTIFTFSMQTAAAAQALPDHLYYTIRKAESLNDPMILDAVIEKIARDYPTHKASLLPWLKTVEKIAPRKAMEEKKWYIPKEAEVELAMSFTSGNVDKEEVFISGNVSFEIGDWHNKTDLKFEGENEKNVRVTEQYEASNKTKYHLSKKHYVFLNLDGEKDDLAGLKYSLNEAFGYGRYLVKEEGLVWSIEGAPGMQQLAYTNGTEQNVLVAFLESNFKWKINDHWRFQNKLQSKISDVVTITQFHNRLDTTLTNHLSLRLGFDVDHYSSVSGRDKSFDIKTRMGLVYGY